VVVDDATRLAPVEVLPDEQKATTVGFLARAVGWFSEQGITCRRIFSDNGSAYRSGDWRKACKAQDLTPIRTRPYTTRTNGKAFQTSEERNQWLPRYLGISNGRRCHLALGGLTPRQSFQRRLIAE
jgi:transposase InsO family protein